MLDRLGKKALVAPFVLIVVLTCVLGLAVAPILRTSPHDITLAVVNLDEGVETPVGTVNAGAVLASQLTGEASEEAEASAAVLAKLSAMTSATGGAGLAGEAAGAAAGDASAAPVADVVDEFGVAGESSAATTDDTAAGVAAEACDGAAEDAGAASVADAIVATAVDAGVVDGAAAAGDAAQAAGEPPATTTDDAAAGVAAESYDGTASVADAAAAPNGTAPNAGAVLPGSAAAETDDAQADGAAATGTASSASSAMADALSWQALDSEPELEGQLDDNQLFGGIVIPADFTAQQMAAKSDASVKPQLTVYVNMGKNPQVASMLQSAMTQALSAAGVAANVVTANNADLGGGSMAGLMAVQMMVMPLLVMTLSGSLILVLLTWKKDVWGLRARNPWLAVAGQLALVAALSAGIAACALAVDMLAGGLTLPFGELFGWLWLGCACVMLAFVGLADACFPLGALVAVCVFALGMGTAMLPAEMLPAFWADWVFPWAPQAHLGQGVRTIVYCGRTPGMDDVAPLLVFAAVGVAAQLLAAGIARARARKA